MMLRLARLLLLRSVAGDVSRGISSIRVAGAGPGGSAVLAANHGSWWDPYVLGLLARRGGHDVAIMMSDAQLARFPFLRLIGAVSPGALRTLVTRVRRGGWALIFPEGAVQSGRSLSPIRGGAGWVAWQADAPLVPVAIRVVMRGAQRPDAFIRFGAPVASADLAAALAGMLGDLDAALDATAPDLSPPGYRTVFDAQRFRRDRTTLAGRALAFLTRTRGRSGARDGSDGGGAS